MNKNIVSIVVLVTALFMFGSRAVAQDWETMWLANNNPTHPNSDLWKGLSSSVYPIAIASPSAILAYGYLKKDKKMQHNGWYIVGSLAVNTAITEAAKYIVNRNRPYVDYPSLIHPQQIESDPSFPSGHTSTAFATATALTITFKKWYVVVPAYAWATGVGYSRLYLGEHYPSDVLAGAIVGTGSAILCNWLNKKFFSK